jgi:hypothetical protein
LVSRANGYLPCSALLRSDGTDPLKCASESGWNRCLHAHLDGFKGAETNVGKEFSGSRGSQVETGLPLFRILLPHKPGVKVLEEFVSSILDGALNRVTEESWPPASKDSSDALSSTNLSPSLEVALVQVRIDLASAFDKIERGNSCMCCAL